MAGASSLYLEVCKEESTVGGGMEKIDMKDIWLKPWSWERKD